jgi:hypothetical protein
LMKTRTERLRNWVAAAPPTVQEIRAEARDLVYGWLNIKQSSAPHRSTKKSRGE